MKETELAYYFPYQIDKDNNFRYFANDNDAFVRRHVPNYDGMNVHEFLYNKSGLQKEEIYRFLYLYENYRHWHEWYMNGKNIFSFSKELLYMLEKTDVDNITPDLFHLPYDIFYISLKPLNIKIAEDSDEIIEGVYIDHNIWNPSGEHPDGYCELGLYFVGDFKNLFLEYIPNVTSRIPITLNNEITYDEFQEGSFWNIWLWFDKREGRENVKQTVDDFLQNQKKDILSKNGTSQSVTDFELDYYNSTVALLRNTINLVINCLLYLSQPTDKVDIEKKYPDGLPQNFNKKLSFSKSEKEIKKVSEKIDKLGFSKINYVGQSYKRERNNLFSNINIQSHWRRGHWRNQRFGEKLVENKLIWILPTIVNKNSTLPVKGHVYDIEKD